MRSSKNILIIDDDENCAKALVRLLKKEGYFPMAVNNAMDALQACKENGFVVCIADERLTETSGHELLKTISESNPSSFRFLISGFSDFPVIIDSFNKGIVHRFFPKPLDHTLLLQAISSAFIQHELDKIKNIISSEFNTTQTAQGLNKFADITTLQWLINLLSETPEAQDFNFSALIIRVSNIEEITAQDGQITSRTLLQHIGQRIENLKIPNTLILYPKFGTFIIVHFNLNHGKSGVGINTMNLTSLKTPYKVLEQKCFPNFDMTESHSLKEFQQQIVNFGVLI